MWYGKDEKVEEGNGLLEKHNKLKADIAFKKKQILQMELDLEVLVEKIKKQL